MRSVKHMLCALADLRLREWGGNQQTLHSTRMCRASLSMASGGAAAVMVCNGGRPVLLKLLPPCVDWCNLALAGCNTFASGTTWASGLQCTISHARWAGLEGNLPLKETILPPPSPTPPGAPVFLMMSTPALLCDEQTWRRT